MSCGLMMLKSDLGVPATVYSDSSGEIFQNRAHHAGADGEEAADGRKCDGGRASGPGSKSVHRKRSLGGMSRADVRWGPRFSSTAPGRDPPSPPPSDFPVGWPLCGGECRAEVRRCGETFQTGPTTQVRTVRKRRTEGSATAAGQAGPGRNRYTVNARSAG